MPKKLCLYSHLYSLEQLSFWHPTSRQGSSKNQHPDGQGVLTPVHIKASTDENWNITLNSKVAASSRKIFSAIFLFFDFFEYDSEINYKYYSKSVWVVSSYFGKYFMHLFEPVYSLNWNEKLLLIPVNMPVKWIL